VESFFPSVLKVGVCEWAVVGGSGAECTAISLENSHTSWLSVQVFREFSESWELESVYVGMGIWGWGCGAEHSRARLLICLAFRGTSESRNYWQDLEHHRRTLRSLEKNYWQSNAFHAALVYLFALICICYFNDLMPSKAPTRRRFRGIRGEIRGILGESKQFRAPAPNGVRSPILQNPGDCTRRGIFSGFLVSAGRKLLGRFLLLPFHIKLCGYCTSITW